MSICVCFSPAKFNHPGVGTEKVGDYIYSRLGLGPGIMMEEDRERDLSLFAKNHGI